MTDAIKDGTGKGYLLKIDNKNRLQNYGVTETEASFINRVEKEAYSGTWEGALTAASTDYIIYLKNTSDKDLIINRVKHRCEGANSTLSFWVNILGTPGGSLTALEPANRNAGSNNQADVTYYRSTQITGLTNGRKIGSLYGKDGEEFEYADPCSGFIIPPNGTFGVKSSETVSEHFGGISFYLRDREE